MALFLEQEEEEPNLEEMFDPATILSLVVGWLGNVASLSQTIGEDIYPLFLEKMLTLSADDILLLLEDFDGLLEEYGIEMPELSPLEGLFFALSLVAVALPALYYADVITELRDDVSQLELEIDLEELLETVLLLYIENAEDIISAYIEPESQGRGGSFMPDLLGRMQATTTSPDSGMMMASSQTSQGNALLSSPTRSADVAYNYALAELNPIRYRGYYRDSETGFYFCQTRYYNPQWRRWISADCMFVANKDPLSGSNMYAYCRDNPVMRADPSGMDDVVTIVILILAAVAAIGELPSVLHDPLIQALTGLVGLARSTVELISMLGTAIGNIVKLYEWIKDLVDLTDLTGNQIGHFLNTGERFLGDNWGGGSNEINLKWFFSGFTIEDGNALLNILLLGSLAVVVIGFFEITVVAAVILATATFASDTLFVGSLSELVTKSENDYKVVTNYFKKRGITPGEINWLAFLRRGR